jgi:molecular chaperone DnaJ
MVHEDCWKCKGGGMTIKYPCTTCQGEGLIEKEVAENIRVKAGIKNGEEIIWKKRGHESTFGNPGDLRVNVTTLKDKRFERKELDIISYKYITPGMVIFPS